MRLSLAWLGCAAAGIVVGIAGCTTVEPGQDFDIADVVYDENYFYCVVEPMLFSQGCGPGDSNKGDPSGGCHFNTTTYRLTGYSPLVFESCSGITPGVAIPSEAQGNYQNSQSRMQLDPNLAPLLNRPTGNAAHPRVIFDKNSPEADIIRQWATQFSTQ